MDLGANLHELFGSLAHRSAFVEAAVLAACLALAWLVVRALRPRLGPTDAQPKRGAILLGERGFDGALFPALALLLAFVAQLALRGQLPLAVFRVALPLLLALALIRLTARVLRAAFPDSRLMRATERSVSWLVWFGLLLWLTGLLPVLLDEAEALHWTVGGARVTLRGLLEGLLTAGLALVVVLWLSAAVESRLMRAERLNLSLRKMLANVLRVALLAIGIVTAMSAAGIPLGALGVLGGAIGVGIGLGLQKLAANYVSGFVILAERSLRIGDVVKVDGFEGRITDISTRFTVLRATNGRESIVPNEMLVTNRVENSSFADPRVALTTVVQVAYGTDLDALAPRLIEAVRGVPRVIDDPSPAVQLSAFAADGLELTIAFWIADLENGQGNVRSDVNLAVLRTLGAAGVDIPFPQRVLTVVPASVGSPPIVHAAAAVGAGAAGAAAAPATSGDRGDDADVV